MNTGDRAHNYATAFYEATFERLLGSLGAAAQALAQQPALLQRLQATDVEFADRQAALDGILVDGVDPMARNLLYTLVQHGDLPLLGEVITSLRARMAQAAAGPTPVEVTTATPLAADQRQALEAKLAGQYGANLAYEYKVDAAILGGMIVRVGDKLIDGSVASRLAALKQTLGVATTDLEAAGVGAPSVGEGRGITGE
jgi:F-type H+-transporting ATPase subunit delta